eukprot:TRINITY_DN12647_c0_g1_i1.p1 TRINITY_DN12647_c0_g1~~TRINITY_DN12647_c0_g1_i1.p1  ORF type:complete len:653 (+),score=130.08 TRINITY_DN12647_c0_g1_i1:163-2121(+)
MQQKPKAPPWRSGGKPSSVPEPPAVRPRSPRGTSPTTAARSKRPTALSPSPQSPRRGKTPPRAPTPRNPSSPESTHTAAATAVAVAMAEAASPAPTTAATTMAGELAAVSVTAKQLRLEVLRLEEENQSLRRVIDVDKEIENARLKAELRHAVEDARVLEEQLRVTAVTGGAGTPAHILQLEKDLKEVRKSNRELEQRLLEESNLVLQFRFEREALALQASRLKRHVKELTAIPSTSGASALISGGGTVVDGQRRTERELAQVVEALKQVVSDQQQKIDKLKREAVSTVKYMDAVHELRALKAAAAANNNGGNSSNTGDKEKLEKRMARLLQQNTQLLRQLRAERLRVTDLQTALTSAAELQAHPVAQPQPSAARPVTDAAVSAELHFSAAEATETLADRDLTSGRLLSAAAGVDVSVAMDTPFAGEGICQTEMALSHLATMERLAQEAETLRPQLAAVSRQRDRISAERDELRQTLQMFDDEFYDDLDAIRFREQYYRKQNLDLIAHTNELESRLKVALAASGSAVGEAGTVATVGSRGQGDLPMSPLLQLPHSDANNATAARRRAPQHPGRRHSGSLDGSLVRGGQGSSGTASQHSSAASRYSVSSTSSSSSVSVSSDEIGSLSDMDEAELPEMLQRHRYRHRRNLPRST